MLLAAILLGSALGLSPNARAAVTIVKDGAPIAKIYHLPIAAPLGKGRTIPPESPLAVAVHELTYHFQKMSGATVEDVSTTDVSSIRGPAIVLGDLAVQRGALPEKKVPSDEGFRLLVKGDQLLIGGQSDAAVLLGVYEVLTKLGCDWVMPGTIGEIVPAKKTIELQAIDESHQPGFLIRKMWYGGGQGSRDAYASFQQWLHRQRSGTYDPPPAQTKGHGWSQFVRKHKAEFDKDPSLFALVRDPATGEMVRRGPQIEVANPRVVELYVADIREAFQKNDWPKDKEVGFSIGPADGGGFSLSAESMQIGSGRIDPISGDLDRTDELVWLGNQIQQRIEAEYPHVWVGFYNYAFYADYPVRYQPHPRIAQVFAPITFSRFHSVVDPLSKTQPFYRTVVEKWAEAAKRQGNALIYRGYNWNLAENLLPYSKLRIWGEELPFYSQMGFLGVDVETVRSWGITGPSDWLLMKMAWDPKQDWKTLTSEYCRKAFGAGAAPMERYFLRLTERQHAAGQEAGSSNAIPLMYDEAFVHAGQKDLAEASELTTTEDDKTRISYFGYGLETLGLYLQYHSACCNFDFNAARARYDDIIALTAKAAQVNGDIVSSVVGIQYLKRYHEIFLIESQKYSTAPYRIVLRLPDELPTLFDPHSAGERMGYYQPELNDAGFVKTKTFGSTWDAQGLGGYRGGVWYRYHFQVPGDATGQPLGLLLGSFDDEARVWLNGKPIGSSGRRYDRAAAFDLTAELNPTADNVLVVEIVRNNVNEIGVGGLIRPSYLFSGPQLEAKSPKPVQLQPSLPGGGEVKAEAGPQP